MEAKKHPFSMKKKQSLFKQMEQEKQLAKETMFCEQTIETVARHFALEDDFTNEGTRKREFVYARQICMALIKKHTKLSLGRIGELIGGKDHATVLHANRTILNLMQTNKQIRSEVSEIERLILYKVSVLLNKKTTNNDLYYINFDNYSSVRFSDEKGIVFTGFNEAEIFRLLTFLNSPPEDTRKHKNTGYYILEK
jgi:hypothetical protein